MAQLIVRDIEDSVVKKLKSRASRHGVSMEEEHRKILRAALLGNRSKEISFADFLRTMPNVGKDEDFGRNPDTGRDVQL